MGATEVKGKFTIHSDQSLKALYHTETTAIPPCSLTEGLQKQGTTAENSGKLNKAIAIYTPTIKKNQTEAAGCRLSLHVTAYAS